MRPVLFHIGSLPINAWGVMAALAFTLGTAVVGRELERHGERRDHTLTLVLAAAIGGLVGAKLYFLGEHPSGLTDDGALSGAGFTWYGGVLGGAAAVLVTAHRLRIPIPVLLGSFAPALALGYAIGRIGCQLAGDGTYGVESDLPWAMSYPDGIVPTAERVHPTPVYETLASLLAFAILWRLRTRLAPTALFGLYLVLAATERFLIELIRRNDHVLLGLTQPQLWALALALGGAALLGAQRARPVPTPSAAG